MWKSIDGYDGIYEVSDDGTVRSLDREIVKSNGVTQFRHGETKKLTENKDGYLTVKLSKDGSDVRVPVHILVAKAFVDGWFDGAEVNHIDFDRKNNNASNLEWVTHAENVSHTINAGRHVCNTDLIGSNNPNFGNHALSERYASNKLLSKEKNSRPGIMNGRSIPITVIFPDGDTISFGYITECADYLIRNGYARAKNVLSVSARISSSAKNGKSSYGLRFKYA